MQADGWTGGPRDGQDILLKSFSPHSESRFCRKMSGKSEVFLLMPNLLASTAFFTDPGATAQAWPLKKEVELTLKFFLIMKMIMSVFLFDLKNFGGT